ncbi:MAG: glycosyltransferase family 4 protein [Ardenticatenaceae bacterium]|nr:glycosyltransferase family 4 protein [Ardenticatenaceae bacterium]
MRVLMITNYYPPCQYDWGYMQLCEETTEALSARGHEVAVLTSVYRHGEEWKRPYPVHRLLPVDPDWHQGESATRQFFLHHRQREQQSVQILRQLVAEFQPDVIFAWHCIGLSRVMLQEAENMPVPMVYYLANYLPEMPDEYIRYWRKMPKPRVARWLKRIPATIALTMLAREGKPVSLRYPNTVCVSAYVRERLLTQGMIPESAVVIHNGIDLHTFSRKGSVKLADVPSLCCLVAGRVAAEKGVHTVINAFAQLKDQKMVNRFALTILGDGPAEYMAYVRGLVQQHGLEEIVTFQPPVPREQMPQVLSQYHIFILPSEYAEPLARAGQEAMGMGLLVVGTTTGGSGELTIHRQTGYVFAAGDAGSLAAQLQDIAHNPQQAELIAQAGQEMVLSHFHMDRMGDEVEQYLASLIAVNQEKERQLA